ncbi:MAG: pyridoxal-phosphate dependent enzyme [Chloroflexi bacterium CFX1]|nr:pyridoxal-phosphate dependent enzyme [Chloroflexi bacterium CFX1]MCQ3954270.1 threonine/serine dehydratase [Chloroflexota bacterium]MDL1919914.1 pyridoxal-phosphate dependent enzyme [Chloroflexi bacterium CFX5]NUQ58832.1 pyridoxal-phosphate dependent enzyme [Anaerolineales bacterium]
MTVSLSDIKAAAKRIAPYIHRTPALTCESLDQRVGTRVFMKCENFQKVGAFKFRGASNAVWSLTDEEAAQGVVTHSSGNHAQALALAAKMRGIPAYIVMPDNAPQVKKNAVAGYGGRITFCEPTLEARESAMERIRLDTGASVIHPYNNELVIAGQGTAALELLEDVPDLDVVIAPVGGGGLLSGTAIAAVETKKGIRVIAAEPETADDAYRSMKTGKIVPSQNPKTVADGLLTSLGTLTFPIIQQRVERIATVSEAAIIESMKFVWERAKIVVEPSAATVIAALLEKKVDLNGLRVGVILSGGNVDLEKLPWQK